MISEFFHAVAHYPFMLHALLTGLLASVACGIVGTYIVSRKITYIAGGIAHSVLGGMGVAHYLQVVYGWKAFDPLYGAIVAALISAGIIGWTSLRMREREDTIIGAVWAIGMAVGIIFIAKTPGYSEDLMSYLFGNVLMVTQRDLLVIASLDGLVLIISILFYNQLLAVCFDEEFARIRGVNVEFFYLLLLGLTALTVVILTTVVGIILVIALLTLPVAIAGRFTRTLWHTMFLSTVLIMFFTTAGLAVSYIPGLPAGATIILVTGVGYLVVVTGFRLFRKSHN